jgi:non-specific serine/threonine protein kinase
MGDDAMTPERWQRAKTVFSALVDLDAEHQERLLADLCGSDDPELQIEVRELLTSSRERGFVDELAACLGAPESAEPMEVLPRRIGRYDVIEPIGEGGMGIVYKARDAQLDRFVAVKLISPARRLDDEWRRRLVIEARATAVLEHPCIATVYEIGETEDGTLFLAMAFYDGETLAARLTRGPLPAPEAVRIGREIARGLAAAHARGIIHRDLKPANVLLTRSADVKIVDFGIAQLPGSEQAQAGEVLGSIGYMAPEQLRGEEIDARADVWAFGVVLSEMLTGKRLTALDLEAGVPVPLPGSLRPGISRELDRIVQRALATRPADRYADGSELLAALEDEHELRGASREPDRRFHLPEPITRFFGRQQEVDEVLRRLAEVRLVTLTGPGGTGKTRLALHIASLVRDRFEEGLVFLSLATLADPALVCTELGRALGIHERPAVSPVESLATFLHSREMLLVLDNFEHVAPAAADIALLLTRCPNLRILVTSRVPLRVAGEHEYLVPPLPRPQGYAHVTVADLEAYPATALFLDRAQAVRPDFTGGGEETQAIAELCHRLDGLPLAIELAAARVKLFSPRAMLARLDRRFELLTSGGRDRPPRHQSLRQALAWSHDLLTTAQQTLFHRLAVFAGGCAFEEITTLSRALGSGEAEVVDGCTALLDHSLVVRDDGPDGMPRLRMLETIREFAFERLQASGEAHRACLAHAERFLALAERSEPYATGPDQAAWFDRLELEHDNLRAALSWAQTNGRRDIALGLGSALWRFWVARGHLREGRERLEQLLAMSGGERSTLLGARVLHGAATLINATFDYSRARPLIEESLAIAREHGDGSLTAAVLNNLAWSLVLMGDCARAGAICEDALKVNRELANPRGIAIALHNLAWLVMWCGGDYDRARPLLEESLDWRRAHGDRRGSAFAMTNLARADIKCDAIDRASRLLEEARTTLEGLKDRQLLAWTLTTQGLLERASGRPADAFNRFEAGIGLWRAVGNVLGLALALVDDADLALDQGKRDRALRDLEEALPLMRGTGHRSGLSDGLRVRARLAAAEGDHERARVFYAEALELYSRLGDTQAIRVCQEEMAGLGNQ